MAELNYEALLKLVQEGNVSEVESLLNVSNEEILGAIGYGKYDDVFEAALAANNPDMMKALLKHSNLITPVSIESAVNEDTQGKLNPQLKKHLKEYLSATNRSNMQKRDFGEWRTEFKRAKEQGFNDLADRIQRRLDFEEQGRQTINKKLPEGTTLNRWLDEKSWIVDGMGRLEYDLYGQKNGDEIVKALADMGIKAQFDAHIQPNGGDNDYRITVDTKDAVKLKEQLRQAQEDLEAIVSSEKDDNETEIVEEVETKNQNEEDMVAHATENVSSQVENVQKSNPENTVNSSKDYAYSASDMDEPEVAAGVEGMFPPENVEKDDIILEPTTVQEEQNKGEEDMAKKQPEVKYDDAEFKQEQMKKAAKLGQSFVFNAKREEETKVNGTVSKELIDLSPAEFQKHFDQYLQQFAQIPANLRLTQGDGTHVVDTYYNKETGRNIAFVRNPKTGDVEEFIERLENGRVLSFALTEDGFCVRQGTMESFYQGTQNMDVDVIKEYDKKGKLTSAHALNQGQDNKEEQSVVYDEDGNIIQREFDNFGREIRSIYINPETGRTRAVSSYEYANDTDTDPKRAFQHSYDENGKFVSVDEYKYENGEFVKVDINQVQTNVQKDSETIAQEAERIHEYTEGEGGRSTGTSPDNGVPPEKQEQTDEPTVAWLKNLQQKMALGNTELTQDEQLYILAHPEFDKNTPIGSEKTSDGVPPVPPTKEEKTPKTKKLSFRDLNTLLDQHQLGEVRNILAGIDTTDPENLEILKKIQEEYEKRAGASYDPEKHFDLNTLIKTEKDVAFANRIDNEMDDGVVQQAMVEVPVAEGEEETVEPDVVPEPQPEPQPAPVTPQPQPQPTPVNPTPNPNPNPGPTPTPNPRPVNPTPVNPTPRPVDPQPQPQPEPQPQPTPVNPQPQPQPQPRPTPETSVYDELRAKVPGKPESWDETDDGQLVYDIRHMSPEAQKLARDILRSYGVPFGDVANGADKGLIYVRDKMIDGLGEYWERADIQNDHDPDLLVQTKPELDNWVSPGFEKNWCCHNTKSLRLDTHEDVKSFSRYPKAWYFKPKNDQEREMALKYLELKGIKCNKETATEDMNINLSKDGLFGGLKNKSANPIKEGEEVLAVRDPESIKKLITLWEHTKIAPEVADLPKGIRPDGREFDRTQGNNGGGRGPGGDGRTPGGDGHGPTGPTGPSGNGNDNGGDGKGGSSKVLDSLQDALKIYNHAVFEKSFDSPEAFGEEMLYQTMAFPFEWLNAYLNKLGLDDGKKAEPSSDDTKGLNKADAKQLAAIQGMMKKMIEKDPGLFKELTARGLLGKATAGMDQETIAENLRNAMKDPANAELHKRWKNCYAAVAQENPQMFADTYSADYKGPLTADKMLEHFASWRTGDDNSHANGGDEHLSAEAKMMAELLNEVKALRAEVAGMRETIAQLRAENEAMRQTLKDLRDGKISPKDIQIPGEEEENQEEDIDIPQDKTNKKTKKEIEAEVEDANEASEEADEINGVEDSQQDAEIISQAELDQQRREWAEAENAELDRQAAEPQAEVVPPTSEENPEEKEDEADAGAVPPTKQEDNTSDAGAVPPTKKNDKTKGKMKEGKIRDLRTLLDRQDSASAYKEDFEELIASEKNPESLELLNKIHAEYDKIGWDKTRKSELPDMNKWIKTSAAKLVADNLDRATRLDDGDYNDGTLDNISIRYVETPSPVNPGPVKPDPVPPTPGKTKEVEIRDLNSLAENLDNYSELIERLKEIEPQNETQKQLLGAVIKAYETKRLKPNSKMKDLNGLVKTQIAADFVNNNIDNIDEGGMSKVMVKIVDESKKLAKRKDQLTAEQKIMVKAHPEIYTDYQVVKNDKDKNIVIDKKTGKEVSYSNFSKQLNKGREKPIKNIKDNLIHILTVGQENGKNQEKVNQANNARAKKGRS